ncbi:MAG: methyltransferase domain-containing protein [Flavobacteriaceae bacterium]|nr:methyltransferase domain-containing protein [Flavobacteriaceae bacterium]
MQVILKIFPRAFLIKLSLLIQPLLSLVFKGSKFTDPINGKQYSRFLSYGYNNIRPNALCPGTLSLERHRLLWLYLKGDSDIENQFLKVLHVAPEQVFFKKFKNFNKWAYTTTDLYSPLADVKANLCNLPFEDDTYDLILCNHVLEHIIDDTKAMEEVYRVLKPGGRAILQVPLDKRKEKSYEDYTITNPKDRNKHFGQYDHVRIYGMDFFDRLSNVGFKCEKINLTSKLSDEDISKYGLIKGELIPVCWK